jgi:hypothetical protein
MGRESALKHLSAAEAVVRRDAAARLGRVGRMQDSGWLAVLLSDTDEDVRAASEAALWRVWARSGDRQVDAL